MPRPMRTPLTENLVTVAKGQAAPAPEPGRQVKPPEEERVATTYRLPASLYKRLRRAAFEAEQSQQAMVEEAIDAHLTARGC
jgi:hypothetical protein